MAVRASIVRIFPHSWLSYPLGRSVAAGAGDIGMAILEIEITEIKERCTTTWVESGAV